MKNPKEMTLTELRVLLYRDSMAVTYCRALLELAEKEIERIKRYSTNLDAEIIAARKQEIIVSHSERRAKRADRNPNFTLPEE